jgi:TonB family protein
MFAVAVATAPAVTTPSTLPATPAWLQAQRSEETAAQAWLNAWGAFRATFFGGETARWRRSMAKEEEVRFTHSFKELVIAEGKFAGRWRFLAEENAARPYAAWRLQMPEQPPYAVRVELFCDEAAGDCELLYTQLAALLAPVPSGTALKAEWETIVADESCEPGQVSMQAPHVRAILMEGVDKAQVKVGVLFNRCGEVRNAWIAQPSGVQAFDKAALQAALRWRLPALDNGERIGRGVVPLTYFGPDAELPPP